MNSILNEIESYLIFGYSLKWEHPDYSINFDNIDKSIFANLTEKELINKGVAYFNEAVNSNFEIGKTNTIPLSGGVDSRLLLAALAEHTDVSAINTYTFGVPGTYDFDIANHIAKKYGTNHINFDLNNHIYTMDELLDMSKRFYYQSPLLIHPPLTPLLEFKDSIIWSGVNAGAVVGSFLKQYPSATLYQAKQNFLNKGAFVKSIDLTKRGKNHLTELMSFNEISNSLLTYDEQTFFKMRSQKHLAPNVLIKGFKYKTPFINNRFMDFMLSLNNNFRFKKYLYNKIAKNAYPAAFKYGIEGNYRLPIDSPKNRVKVKRNYIKIMNLISNTIPGFYFQSPMINYLDFNLAIRQRKDIQHIIYANIFDLKKRNLIDWVNFDKLWKEHMNNTVNRADALIALASLEIHLKAGKNIDS